MSVTIKGMSQTGPNPVNAAKWFAQQGFHIFPVWGVKGGACRCPKGKACGKNAGKHPATANGFKDGTRDIAQIEKFLSNPGTPNYGMTLPENVIAIDVDGSGLTKFDELRDRTGGVPETLTTKTPHGFHYFFDVSDLQLPKGQLAGFVVRRGAADAEHADGYVVGPGSVGLDGTYDAIRRPDGMPYSVARLPAAWASGLSGERNKAAEPPATTSGLRITIADVESYEVPSEPVAEGGRYEAIRDYVASRYNTGLSHDEIHAAAYSALVESGLITGLTPQEFDERFERTWKGIEERLGPPSKGEKPAPKVVTQAELGLIVSIADYKAAIPDKIEWIVPGMIYLGGITLIAGGPKAGKSTLMSNLQRARESSDTFLGFKVPPGPTLLVTEERGHAVAYKAETLATLDVLDLATARKAGLNFQNVVDVIRMWGSTRPGALVFIDTLAAWADIEDENSATQTTQAIGDVMPLAEAGMAVVIVHHTRKGGGEYGEGIRGSGAILASVDMALELWRLSPTSDERMLDVMGRLGMPESMRLAFDRPTKTYSVVGADAALEALLAGVPMEGSGAEGLGLPELGMLNPELTPAKIRELVAKNYLRMTKGKTSTGRGVKNLYHRVAEGSSGPVLRLANSYPPTGGSQSGDESAVNSPTPLESSGEIARSDSETRSNSLREYESLSTGVSVAERMAEIFGDLVSAEEVSDGSE